MGTSPSRAVAPDADGVVVRDGVRLAYEVFGDGHEPTVLMLPTWSIVPSGYWKAQVAHLARRYRVVTFDGRGSGRSDAPLGAAAYGSDEYARDVLAVLDATSTPAAVLVAFSCGAAWALQVAAERPGRVLALVAIAPSCGFAIPEPARDGHPWDQPLERYEGWDRYNKHNWLAGDYDAFLQFFFAQMSPEPHSSKQIEDGVAWGHEIAPCTLVDTEAARLGREGAQRRPAEALCARVRCPVLVIHGTRDRIRSHATGERLAELTGGTLVLLEGAGHGAPARDPVVVNRLLSDFVDRVHPRARRRSWTRAARRPLKALYLSSPIGLGHVRRDLAIAAELQQRRPDLQIDWLSQHPVTRVLTDAGARVHPASALLANESGHIEAEAGEHDLHAFQAIRRMDEILVGNFMLFSDVVTEGEYDLVIGDEAWDVDHFLHENPELKTFSFAWLTDFVGWLPMPEGGEAEAALTADYNAEMLEHRARFRRVRDRSVFVGNPEDVVDLPFGPGLPSIRDWTAQNYDFSGYVTGFTPPEPEETAALRASIGVREQEQLCLVTVGGSGVGSALLQAVLRAVPRARALVPELVFVVVAGPRIDPRSLPVPPGAQVRGYVPELYRYLAACDVAVVQGGLTTTMELTALGKPFVHVPLRNHFEQNVHVRQRLDRYGAGRRLEYDEAVDPDRLAEVVAKELLRPVAYRPVETDGAARAATLLASLL